MQKWKVYEICFKGKCQKLALACPVYIRLTTDMYLTGANDSYKISESEQRNHNHQSLGSLHHSSVVVHGSLRAELAEDNLITNIMLHKTGSL